MSVARCPFPPCQWQGEPLHYRVSPSSTDTNSVLPLHDVVGPHAWFGRCPGSSLYVPTSPDGARVIADTIPMFVRALNRRIAEHYRREVAAGPGPTIPPANESNLDRVLREVEERGGPPPPTTDGIVGLLRRHGPNVDPRARNEDYFPGRPADAPEPGPNDPPAALPAAAKDAEIVPLGGQMDNARDNLTAMIRAAGAAAGETVSGLAMIRGQIETAQSLLVATDVTAVQALSLMRVAVGADASGAPQAARDMVAMMNFGRTTMVGNADESVTWALDAAHNAITAAISRVMAAQQHAATYAAMPR